MANCLIQLHPQLTYLARILAHLESCPGDFRGLILRNEYAPLSHLNAHFRDFIIKKNLLKDWSRENHLSINTCTDIIPDPTTYNPLASIDIKHYPFSERSAIPYVVKDLIYAAAIDSMIQREVSCYVRSDENTKRRLIKKWYIAGIHLYYYYLESLRILDISRVYLSHGNFVEYVSLICASLAVNAETYVFHGGFAHKYRIHKLGWGQPGPVNALLQWQNTADIPKWFNRPNLSNVQQPGFTCEGKQLLVAYQGLTAPSNSLAVLTQRSASKLSQDNHGGYSENIVLIALHCLTDQNHNFSSTDGIFRTYSDWMITTLRHIDSTSKIIIKMHPHSDKFGETRLVMSIIKHALQERQPQLNMKIVQPNEKISSNELGVNPVVITAGGTIALEMAAQGKVCITTTKSVCPDNLVVRYTSLASYISALESHENLRRAIDRKVHELSPKNIATACHKLSQLEMPFSQGKSRSALERFNRYYFFGATSYDEVKHCFIDDYRYYISSFRSLKLESPCVDLLIEESQPV
jgi:hypothetical protein